MSVALVWHRPIDEQVKTSINVRNEVSLIVELVSRVIYHNHDGDGVWHGNWTAVPKSVGRGGTCRVRQHVIGAASLRLNYFVQPAASKM